MAVNGNACIKNSPDTDPASRTQAPHQREPLGRKQAEHREPKDSGPQTAKASRNFSGGKNAPFLSGARSEVTAAPTLVRRTRSPPPWSSKNSGAGGGAGMERRRGLGEVPRRRSSGVGAEKMVTEARR